MVKSKNYIVKIDGEFKEVFTSLAKANAYLRSYKNVNDVEFTYEVVSEITNTKVVRQGNNFTVSAYDKEPLEVMSF